LFYGQKRKDGFVVFFRGRHARSSTEVSDSFERKEGGKDALFSIKGCRVRYLIFEKKKRNPSCLESGL